MYDTEKVVSMEISRKGHESSTTTAFQWDQDHIDEVLTQTFEQLPL